MALQTKNLEQIIEPMIHYLRGIEQLLGDPLPRTEIEQVMLEEYPQNEVDIFMSIYYPSNTLQLKGRL